MPTLEKPLPLAKALAPEDPPFRFETRLAVVLYGGVSLAIYINGVAQELLHMVRATAPEASADPQSPMFTDAELTPVERVYREVGRRMGGVDPYGPPGAVVRNRIVVDVLSGTSAGGLNGLFLAKALANGSTMDQLRDLWIHEGDLDLLLNDSGSRKNDPVLTALGGGEPTSLLNSQRMLRKLLAALRGMNGAAERSEPLLADELDLFVTATDLAGVPLPLRISNGLIYESRHKNVFHFVGGTQRATGGSVNDFRPVHDPFLAFAGRCTSSFPVAFEPMELADLMLLPDGMPSTCSTPEALAQWQRFFRDYLRNPAETGRSADKQVEDFTTRPFGDGGYLDNKPFSHAIGALQWRQAGANVHRKLIYVEPSPDHPEDSQAPTSRPDPFANLMAAASNLPREETIREDLELVLERNRRIEHVQRATRFLPDDVQAAFASGAPKPARAGADYAMQWLSDMVRDYGVAYGTYHRIKVAELTSELAEVVARVAGLDEDSDDVLAVRAMMSAWRQEGFDVAPPSDAETRADRRARGLPAEQWASENQLLLDYDLSYRLRRITFVRDVIQQLDGLESAPRGASAAASFPDARAVEILTGAGFGAQAHACRADLAGVRAALHEVAMALADMYRGLRVAGRMLRARETGGRVAAGEPPRAQPSPLFTAIAGLQIGPAERRWILDEWSPRRRVARARAVLGLATAPVPPPSPIAPAERKRLLNEAASCAADVLAKAFESANALLETQLPRPMPLEGGAAIAPPAAGAPVAEIVRRALRYYYDRFDLYDMVLFPLAYGADVGELAEVQVIRVSPEDARGLVCERDPASRQSQLKKLAGTRLGNFGAFLDPTWRRSDILWGRLDAADILLDQLLPPADPARPADLATRTGVIRRAQAAILAEDLVCRGESDGRRVLVEAFLHTDDGHPDPQSLLRMLERVTPYAAEYEGLAALLDREAVMREYERAFRDDRELAPEKAHRLLARSVAIFGRILEGVSGPATRITLPLGRQMAIAGRVAWGFIELAIPKSLLNLLFRQWLQLAYVLEAILYLGGMFLPGATAAKVVAAQLFLLTLAVHGAVALLRRRYGGDRGIGGRVLGWIKGIAIVAVLAFLAIGVLMSREFWHELLARFPWLAAHLPGLR